jgi:hypothetical protein
MAIQLNDRDHLIFKLIDEHQVLLEKHISWFISGDDKPVLIRDRLRKLFYLDYLLCHRHATKLPWWTTPTKPLVYMLSSMTRSVSGLAEEEIDLFDSNIQRHLLEVANIRMLFLVGVRDTQIREFEWTTCKLKVGEVKGLDAKAVFRCGDTPHRVGIMNHPGISETLIPSIESSLQDTGVEKILIVSRDDAHQVQLQKALAGASSMVRNRCLFATHHELYRTGIVVSNWQSCEAVSSTAFKPAGVADSKNWTNPVMSATPMMNTTSMIAATPIIAATPMMTAISITA